MNIDVRLNKCVRCGCTEHEEKTFESSNAIFTCVKCGGAMLLKSSPEYEEKCRQDVIRELEAKRPLTIPCPYCNSNSTSKISTTSRMVLVGLFGLGSKKLGKN